MLKCSPHPNSPQPSWRKLTTTKTLSTSPRINYQWAHKGDEMARVRPTVAKIQQLHHLLDAISYRPDLPPSAFLPKRPRPGTEEPQPVRPRYVAPSTCTRRCTHPERTGSCPAPLCSRIAAGNGIPLREKGVSETSSVVAALNLQGWPRYTSCLQTY
jgi:hypothetical protein